MMKGVILAGGSGTRLRPFTRVMNKHLLPVGPFPMIYWPIQKLKESGIKDILIITNPGDIAAFFTLLGNGEGLGVTLSYMLQNQAGGIANALNLAKSFVMNEKFVVLLGDNIFEDTLTPYIEQFNEQSTGARILLKRVKNPQRFGVATLDSDSKLVTSIIEKPEHPDSDYCVTGIYMYGPEAFEYIKQLAPSARGEVEITDLNNLYIRQQTLQFSILEGWWVDAGTPRSLFQANKLVYKD